MLEDFFAHCRKQVQQQLDYWLPAAEERPQRLHQAMRYSALGQGKYIRPIMVYASGKVLGLDEKTLDAPACAIEMIHAYSLIHDDLPAMDDDDLRRGRPTCHRVYDEATAILAGNSLQALAFDIIANDTHIIANETARIAMIKTLAVNSGSLGMAGGQVLDLQAVGQQINLTELEEIHKLKTASLIRASLELGSLSHPDTNKKWFSALSHYGHCIGLAFQVKDDILDEEAETETLGKPKGSDKARNKPTYTTLLGLDKAKTIAQKLRDEALDALSIFSSNADILRDIADYIVYRDK